MADVVDLRLERGSDHDIVVVDIGADMNLVGCAEQVDINLESPAEVPAGDIAEIRVDFEDGPRDRLVIALDGLIESPLRPLP